MLPFLAVHHAVAFAAYPGFRSASWFPTKGKPHDEFFVFA